MKGFVLPQEEALKGGRIRINGQIVDKEAVVREHDVVTHLIHRHEPPITSEPIKIVHQSDQLIVIDKPGSIPVRSTPWVAWRRAD